MPRVLMYSQDGMGLGHLRRTCNIAREILARAPDSAILIVGDSPALSLFPPPKGTDYLKLPTVVKTGDTMWRTGGFALDVASTLKLRARLMRDVFAEFRPDIVLVDHMPVGALGELKPMLDYAVRGRRKARLFLGLRDVLDAPEVIRRVWAWLDAYGYLAHYEAVLIYGCPGMYDASAAYDIAPYARQVVYCHYVTASGPAACPAAGERFVLFTGGGGADAYPLVRAFLQAFPLVARGNGLRAMVLPGPNMSPADIRSLSAEARCQTIEVASGFQDAMPWVRSASAIVTMAGYNSLCEAMHARAKALVVPRRGPSAEQRIRTEMFARHRLVAALDPDELTVDSLAQRLTDLLSNGDALPDPASIPPLDGAARAAEFMLDGAGRQATFSLSAPSRAA